MARVPEQPLFSGTISNMIFYSVGGKQYVRSKPARVKQPNTPAQLQARDKFRQSSKLAKAISVAAPILGKDENNNLHKSSYHTLLGAVRNSAFEEGSSPARWIWSELRLREGKVLSIALTSRYDIDNSVLTVGWDSTALEPEAMVLLTVIDTENLDAEVFWVEGDKAEATLSISGKAACYACVFNTGAKHPISGSVFVWQGGGR